MLLQVVCPFADVRARRLTHKLLHFDPVHVSDVPGVSTFRNSVATKSAGHLPFINTNDSVDVTELPQLTFSPTLVGVDLRTVFFGLARSFEGLWRPKRGITPRFSEYESTTLPWRGRVTVAA